MRIPRSPFLPRASSVCVWGPQEGEEPGPTGPPAQSRGKGCRAPDPPHGASTSVLCSLFAGRRLPRLQGAGLTACAGGPGGLQDGSGGPGALTGEGMELQLVSWGWGGGRPQGVEHRAPHVSPRTPRCLVWGNGHARPGLLVTRGPGWCEHRGCTGGPGGPGGLGVLTRRLHHSPWTAASPVDGSQGLGLALQGERVPWPRAMTSGTGVGGSPYAPGSAQTPDGALSPSLLAPLCVLVGP